MYYASGAGWLYILLFDRILLLSIAVYLKHVPITNM